MIQSAVTGPVARPAPRSRDNARAVVRTASANGPCRPASNNRSAGPTIPSAPAGRPDQSNTAAASPASPSVAS